MKMEMHLKAPSQHEVTAGNAKTQSVICHLPDSSLKEAAMLEKMIMAWHCQRPNIASAPLERREHRRS